MSPWRAFALGSLAWFSGVVVAAVGGVFLGLFAPGPAATVFGAVAMGALYGLAQRRVLGAPKKLVLITAAVAPIAWLLGAFVGFRLFASGLGAVAPWIEGTLIGAVLSAAQSIVLPTERRRGFVFASVAALGLAIGPMLAPAAPVFLRLFAMLVPGLFAAALAARLDRLCTRCRFS